jgi:adenine-specific DNA-methyltransferase
VGDSETSENKIIHGDNLDALKSLLPEYEGKVKCIYIDPPYNTGNEWWIYNDNVSDPKLQKWLWDVVGKEWEDLTRHDKWLCMMYPRLKLLYKLLAEDGIIMISIADHEISNLRLIMDEIFWMNNFISNFIWDNDGNIDNQSKIKIHHEYILTYAKKIDFIETPMIVDPNIEETSKLYNEIIENSITKNGPKNPISTVVLPIWFPTTFDSGFIPKRNDTFPYIHNNIIVENFQITEAVTIESWWSSKNLLLLFIDNWFAPIEDKEWKETTFKITNSWAIYCYKKRSENQWHVLSVLRNMGTTKQMSNFLKTWDMDFSFPKPVYLVEYILNIFTRSNDLILDSFAGSGTTAHAVLNLNKKDGWNRKFILIETEEYAETITAERVKRVIQWYGKTEWTGGDFDYYTLGSPLMTTEWLISDDASLADIRAYVCYTETGRALEDVQLVDHPYWLARTEDRDHYFYYERDRLTVLDREFLSTITVSQPYYTIWADRCDIPLSLMKKQGITFRKIPRDIRNI